MSNPPTDPIVPAEAASGPTPTEAVAAARTPESLLRRGWTGADVFRAATVALATWIGFLLLWKVYPLVFLVFLGTLFGLAVASGVDVLERFHIRRGIASALIVFSVVAALAGTLAWTGPTLIEQSQELQTQVPAALEKLQKWVDTQRGTMLATVIKSAAAPAPGAPAAASGPVAPTAAGRRAQADSLALPSAAIKQKATALMVGASKYLFSFLTNTLTILGGVVLIIFLSIYIGAEPEVYRGWILSVVPAHHRSYMRLVLGEMSTVLRKWLVTQMIAMVVIGLASMTVLLLMGVKAPYALAIIAGLMEFVPTIGPLISAVPAVLMAFVDSPQLALWVAVAYWGIQFVENNLLIPFLMRGEMDLPPAITIVAQALMTVVFGFIGLMVAVPLTAAVLVPIRMIAIRENAREKTMVREARIAKARAALDSATDAEDVIDDADKGPSAESIRATRKGKVARRSAELGNMTVEMAIPKSGTTQKRIEGVDEVRAVLNGVELAYDDSGSGTAVLFIHGFPHDRSLWSEQVSALSTHVRCIAPDLRGFGESSTDGPYSVDQYADDLAQLLTHLSVEHAIVCGLSMGGYIAMAMWRRHQDRVLALVLCDTKAGADTEEGRRKRDELIAVVEREGSAKIAELQLPGMVGKTTRVKRPDIVERARSMMQRAPVPGIVGALTALRDRPDSTETLGTVTVPTRVVVGDEDVLTPVAEAEGIMKALGPKAQAKLEIVQGSGHASCMERPAAVTHVLADFLAALSVHS